MTTRSRILSLVAMAGLLAGAALLERPAVGVAGRVSSGSSSKNPICQRLGNGIQASAGAQMYCFGPLQNGSGSPSGPSPVTRSSIANVNAANPSEDISPAGVRGYGQSEVSTAAVGNYVVEAWNDSTSFFSPCPSPMNKQEGTGFGFSADGGKTFTDLGGLPNDCTTGFFYSGDPAVEGWQSGNSTYFYIASLYLNHNNGNSEIAMDACQVTGSTLTCGSPIIVATGAAGTTTTAADFLDKDFAAIYPGGQRLYVSYTRFTGGSIAPPFTQPFGNGQIELAVCDLSTPGSPTCYSGSNTTPYLVVQAGDPNCENEGAYPAVDRATGDVYVAWEFNWATNFSNPSCQGTGTPTAEDLARVPGSCLILTPTATCSVSMTSVKIVSMDTAFIPGYNRFPMNDFPRIAVSNAHHTVSLVWNDARFHVLGDVLLQSFSLGSLTAVQTTPALVNSRGTAHFLPALRYTNGNGNLVVAWYERSSGNTAVTSFVAANNVDPRAGSHSSEVTVSNVSTNWDNVSSDIVPNFGDYTDVYTAPNVGPGADPDVNAYYAWSDGRSGDPQPYSAHTQVSG